MKMSLRVGKRAAIYLIILLVPALPSSNSSWQRVDNPTDDPLHDIEWASGEVGYAYTYGTGKVLKTVDGGTSWSVIRRLDSVYFEQMHFFNKDVGWICGNKNKLLKTIDGGNTWNEYTVASDTSGIAFYGMAFRNKKTGYLAQLIPKGKTLHSRIFQTTDSGNTWQPIHTLPEMILNLEWHDGQLWGSGNNVIIRRINHPQKWAYSYHDTAGKAGQIRDLEFVGKEAVRAVSFNGYVLSSRNNGSWKETRLTQNRLRNIKQTGPDMWVAAGDTNKEPGNLFTYKPDAGWSGQSTTFPDIHRLAASQNRLWAVGKEGLIMHRPLQQ